MVAGEWHPLPQELSMIAVDVLYTAHATAIGGRNGHTQSDDGLVSVDLSVPKAMGGPGKPGATTPEDLFAAGYAACFGGACEFMAKQMKLNPGTIEVRSTVSIGTIQPSGFGLRVHLDVKVPGLSQADAEKVVAAGDKLCPYSNAIRNNVGVTITTKAA
jgi:osmotically inducible protein OsmC